jgi:hypothetical protein
MKYVYHYCCRIEGEIVGILDKYVKRQGSGLIFTDRKIDNQDLYDAAKIRFFENLKNGIEKYFTKDDVLVISLSFLHEVADA